MMTNDRNTLKKLTVGNAANRQKIAGQVLHIAHSAYDPSPANHIKCVYYDLGGFVLMSAIKNTPESNINRLPIISGSIIK
jgi:hypothetical protein